MVITEVLAKKQQLLVFPINKTIEPTQPIDVQLIKVGFENPVCTKTCKFLTTTPIDAVSQTLGGIDFIFLIYAR